MRLPKKVLLTDLKSYLLGAMHDGTVRRHTVRLSQKEEAYVLLLKELMIGCGRRAWTYKEGRSRDLYVLEFSRSLLEGHRLRSRKEVIHYVRGYFDAEGSVASPMAPDPYLYFGQKDRSDLARLREMLGSLGVSCGKIHNPSRRADPDYWRFFVSRRSIPRFAKVVGSWHPRKAGWLVKVSDRFQNGG
jgi:hypothetical protein